ncbi:beta-N-acetylhexosaminidase [Alloacidobacterium dinghuense]|uniref:beta-N-acetylhexosaminidase n=1 Tax=Alloacidobacterium dinghuense TaxID=2763107 RepID=A0A7G8BN33_9BACT|nr:beta-N-acetylhexosaminidase [Alloacidobacterium dinghuense]QNI33953.1 beta-N-acetylhexosaminidase [Alloacidobacterium dinghuense]
MSTTLRRMVGQLTIVGLEGPELTSSERTWLKLIRPSGIILFRRNIDDAEQTVRLLREAAQITGAPNLRCVDLEGGLVDRLRDLIAPMPSPAEVYATRKPALFKKHGRLIAQEVRSLGFNTVFAPVLDLALPASASVMRTRTVSADPAEVIAYGAAFLDGLAAEGILGSGKHFPGLGGGNLDSHHAMPVIQRSWKEMWAADIAPFYALSRRLPMIMVAHAAYPNASKSMLPASISPFWISDVLRKRLLYRGLIVSDDMEMGGILTQRSMEEAAVEAIAAGTDVIEICRNQALVFQAYEALLSEAERSPSFRRRVQQAAGRVLRSKNKLLAGSVSRPPSPRKLEQLRRQVQELLQ